MSPLDIIRAWKDEDYRLSLSNAPESPVGVIELTDADMGLLAGGWDSCDCCDHHTGGGSKGHGNGPDSKKGLPDGPPGCLKKRN
jgi:mersacidin/lichenicidin family type 2 lantibiotic